MNASSHSRGLWMALILGTLAGASIAAYRARRRQHALQGTTGAQGVGREDNVTPLRPEDESEASGRSVYTPGAGAAGSSTLPGQTSTSGMQGPGSTVL